MSDKVPPKIAPNTPIECLNSIGEPLSIKTHCHSAWKYTHGASLRRSPQLERMPPLGVNQKKHTSANARRKAVNPSAADSFSQAILGPRFTEAWKAPAMNSGGTICRTGSVWFALSTEH